MTFVAVCPCKRSVTLVSVKTTLPVTLGAVIPLGAFTVTSDKVNLATGEVPEVNVASVGVKAVIKSVAKGRAATESVVEVGAVNLSTPLASTVTKV